MKGTKNFIIQLDEIYSETFKTKGGLEIFGNVDFTTERQSNRVAKVVGIPALYKTEIKEGYEVLIDASPFYRQIYQGTKQYYQNIVDEDKNQFYLEKDMIICYRENEKADWKGFLKNCLVKPIMEEPEIKKKTNSLLILPETVTKPKFSGKVTMTYSNSEINTMGVRNGDVLHIDKRGGIKYWLNGVEYWWIRNKDVFALQLN